MKLIVIFCFVCTSVAFGQPDSGPRITSLGNSGVAVQDVWSMQANQAGIAGLKKITGSVAFQSNYLNPEISTKSAVFVLPFGQNTFGLSFRSYGFSAYSEQKIGFSYAKSFGTVLFVSLNINYHQLKIQQYGSASAYSVETGLQYYIDDRLLLGVHVANPTAGNFRTEAGLSIPVIIRFGTSYQAISKLLLTAELEKQLNLNTDFKTGIEYTIVQWISLRGGVTVNPFKYYTGFGVNHKGFGIDMAVSSHPDLGISPQLALSYEF